MRLLLLEDDLQLGKALQSSLAYEGYDVVWLRLANDAFETLKTEQFSAALIDIGLPDGSGLDLLSNLRRSGNKTLVIMLTARDAVDDRIRGLDSGADDYLSKPFAVEELLSRIRALFRRSAGFADNVWRVGALSIEPLRQIASLHQKQLDLSQREFILLTELAKRAGRFVTRAQLEQSVLSSENGMEGNALEVHIHNLRKKIGAERIRTIRGVGYSLEEIA
jgi:two-component system, OmpR family, response regulator QseB